MLGPQSTNATRSYPLVLTGYQNASLTGVFTGSETFSAILSSGDDQAPVGTLTAAWDTTIAGNPATVATPTIKLTVSTSVISALAPGIYFYQVLINPGSDNLEAARGRIQLRLAAGTAVALPTYCSWNDMTRVCSWIATLMTDEDQSGFAEQRNWARNWFEDVLFAHDRGQIDRAWFEGGWLTPTTARSQWLKAQLAGGIVTGFTITNGGSGYVGAPTVTITDTAGIGKLASASATVTAGAVTNVEVLSNGYGYINAQVAFTPTNGGSGAAATAILYTPGALILNPDVVRANAYYALAEVLQDEIGTREGTPFQSLADYYRGRAESLVKTIVAELDTNGDGIPDYVIDLTGIKVRQA